MEPQHRMAHEPPTISVVIPARNASATLGQQLDALASQQVDEPWEVIVADNGSTDETRVIARSFADRLPDLRVVDAATSVGVNAARNAGIRHSRGEYILICDADDVVAPGWLSALRAALSRFDLTGGTVDVTALNRSPVAELRRGPPASQLRVVGRFLPSPIGANMGIRREVWRALGGFDETWSGGGDETEFCWRAQLAGWSLGFAADAIVAYRYRDSPAANLEQIRRYAEAQVRLYREFRAQGMPRSSLRTAVKGWIWLAYRITDLRHPGMKRSAWRRRLAQRIGFLRGSIRFRVLYL